MLSTFGTLGNLTAAIQWKSAVCSQIDKLLPAIGKNGYGAPVLTAASGNVLLLNAFDTRHSTQFTSRYRESQSFLLALEYFGKLHCTFQLRCKLLGNFLEELVHCCNAVFVHISVPDFAHVAKVVFFCEKTSNRCVICVICVKYCLRCVFQGVPLCRGITKNKDTRRHGDLPRNAVTVHALFDALTGEFYLGELREIWWGRTLGKDFFEDSFLFCPKNYRKRTQLEFEIKKFISKFTRFPCHHFFVFSCFTTTKRSWLSIDKRTAGPAASGATGTASGAEFCRFPQKCGRNVSRTEDFLRGKAARPRVSEPGAVETGSRRKSRLVVLSSHRLPTTSSDFPTSHDRFMS